MLVLPAVDIKDGACVRLRQGKANETTVFAKDPVEAALAWERQGARYLHVIDLDGAFEGEPTNRALVRDICSKLQIPVELGGGIRSMETAKAYMEAGVTRLLIGTVAIDEPELLARMCEAYPGKIGVSLDAKKGILKTKGWTEDSGVKAVDAVKKLVELGCAFIVYTDIERDGMQQGVNLEEMRAICEASPVPVLAAGGVTTLDDIKKLYPLTSLGLEGAISGRALYEKTLDLAEANAWIDSQKAK